MNDQTSPIPTGIKRHQDAHCLEISFDDGARFNLSYKYLRVFSRDAEVKAATCGDDVTITHIEPVGSYTVNLQFYDGHICGSVPKQ